jgi:hypothetical protein
MMYVRGSKQASKQTRPNIHSLKMKRTAFPLPPQPQPRGPLYIPPPQPQPKIGNKPASISFPTKDSYDSLKLDHTPPISHIEKSQPLPAPPPEVSIHPHTFFNFIVLAITHVVVGGGGGV